MTETCSRWEIKLNHSKMCYSDGILIPLIYFPAHLSLNYMKESFQKQVVLVQLVVTNEESILTTCLTGVDGGAWLCLSLFLHSLTRRREWGCESRRVLLPLLWCPNCAAGDWRCSKECRAIYKARHQIFNRWISTSSSCGWCFLLYHHQATTTTTIAPS
jgi:hypothetical protein